LQERDFLRFWLTSSFNSFSEQISTLALPLTAVLVLHAGPAQMGTMLALQTLPFLLFGLPAGVWLDRRAKFPIVFWAQLLFPLILGAIPVAYWLGVLTMHWLYATSFLIGFGYVISGSASQVYLTHLVGRERLLDAQSRFATTDSIARLVGPGIAGILIHWITAPITLLVNTILFAGSFWNLCYVKNRDATPETTDNHPLRDMLDGLKFVYHHPILFSLAWSFALWHIVFYAFAALQVLFVTKELHMSPGVMGLVQTLGGLGVLLSSLIIKPLTNRFGLGPTILLGFSGTILFWITLPCIPPTLFGSHWASIIWYGVMVFIFDCSVMILLLPYLSLRQKLTPDAMLGRMISTMRTLTIAMAPVGAYVGGWLGEHLSLRPALGVIGGVSVAVWLLMLLTSPLRKVHQ
jgi:MFS family permease